MIGYSRGYNANVGVCHFDPVEGAAFAVLRQFIHTFFHENVAALCHGRHHNVFLYVLFIWLLLGHYAVAKLYKASGMSNTGGKS